MACCLKTKVLFEEFLGGWTVNCCDGDDDNENLTRTRCKAYIPKFSNHKPLPSNIRTHATHWKNETSPEPNTHAICVEQPQTLIESRK